MSRFDDFAAFAPPQTDFIADGTPVSVSLSALPDTDNEHYFLAVKRSVGPAPAIEPMSLVSPDSIHASSEVVVFLIDASGSMNGSGIEAARAFAKAIFATLSPDTQVGYIAFRAEMGMEDIVQPKKKSEWQTNRVSFDRRVDSITPDGQTPLYETLLTFQNILELPKSSNITLVLFSDGADSTRSHTEQTLFSALAKQWGHRLPRIFSVGLGKDYRGELVHLLHHLADFTKGAAIDAVNSKRLTTQAVEFAEKAQIDSVTGLRGSVVTGPASARQHHSLGTLNYESSQETLIRIPKAHIGNDVTICIGSESLTFKGPFPTPENPNGLIARFLDKECIQIYRDASRPLGNRYLAIMEQVVPYRGFLDGDGGGWARNIRTLLVALERQALFNVLGKKSLRELEALHSDSDNKPMLYCLPENESVLKEVIERKNAGENITQLEIDVEPNHFGILEIVLKQTGSVTFTSYATPIAVAADLGGFHLATAAISDLSADDESHAAIKISDKADIPNEQFVLIQSPLPPVDEARSTLRYPVTFMGRRINVRWSVDDPRYTIDDQIPELYLMENDTPVNPDTVLLENKAKTRGFTLLPQSIVHKLHPWTARPYVRPARLALPDQPKAPPKTGLLSGLFDGASSTPKRKQTSTVFKVNGRVIPNIVWYQDQPFDEVKHQFKGYDLRVRGKLIQDHDTPLSVGLENESVVHALPNKDSTALTVASKIPSSTAAAPTPQPVPTFPPAPNSASASDAASMAPTPVATASRPIDRIAVLETLKTQAKKVGDSILEKAITNIQEKVDAATLRDGSDLDLFGAIFLEYCSDKNVMATLMPGLFGKREDSAVRTFANNPSVENFGRLYAHATNPKEPHLRLQAYLRVAATLISPDNYAKPLTIQEAAPIISQTIYPRTLAVAPGSHGGASGGATLSGGDGAPTREMRPS